MRKLRVDVTPPATMSGVHTIACDVVPGSALFKVLGDSKTTKCPSGAATAADDDDASDASDTDSDSDEDKCQAWLLHYVFTAVDPVYNAEVCSQSTYTPDKVVGPGRLKDVIAAGKGGAAAIEWAAFDEYVPGCDHRADDEEKEEDEGNDVGGDEVLKERRSPRERGRMGTSHDDGCSLFTSPRTPPRLRVALPLLLCANVLLFVSSNTATGATVKLAVALMRDEGGGGGSTSTGGGGGAAAATIAAMELPPLYEFSLVNTVSEMWRAKAYALASLIAVFSGGWPYLKLGAMLVSWFVPCGGCVLSSHWSPYDRVGVVNAVP